MYLIFDTETTGLPKKYNAPLTDLDNWPRLVQLAWQIHDEKGGLVEVKNFIVKPDGFTIPYDSEKIHGISTDRANREGVELKIVLEEFAKSVATSKLIIGHNVQFDVNIMGAEYLRAGVDSKLMDTEHLCTKDESTDFCAIPGGRGGKFKWPKLIELHHKLFNEGFDEAHNAAADVEATTRCFLELVRVGVISKKRLGVSDEVIQAFKANNPEMIQPIGLAVESYKEEKVIEEVPEEIKAAQSNIDLKNTPFTHLHVHTEYSVLDGAAKVDRLIKKAKDDGMKAIAITDHGNMFGAKAFHKTAMKEGIKPILGCEVYVARRTRHDKKDKIDASGNHLILLAKNEEGYKNLIKMVSYSWLEGTYYKPRIDKELLRKYNKGVIATSACLGGEISQKIMKESVEEAGKAVLEFKEIFGDDFYLELQRHKTDDPAMNEKVYNDQVFVNKHILELAAKHNVKYIASNDVHFVDAEDADAHDRLICINTAAAVSDPNRMRYTRQEWFKTQTEMRHLFADLPEAIANTNEIADKIEEYKLDKAPIMPDFIMPEGFDNEDDYLRHITYEGVNMRWPELTDEIRERVDFELETIKKMGFPGYFLIVWDFLKAARKMGVSVGPGRGSAAGSAVAYSLRITEIDPIKYDLLFERFLNPDRVSMPDIDIDFDDDGRGKVMEWVVNKYGKKRVAHIITFGTMAAKSAIRDVARVQELPLPESDRLAKMIPDKPGTTLAKAFKEVPELLVEKNSGTEEVMDVLKNAVSLEGMVRNTGTHACGVIIGKEDLENYIPISTAKDSELTYVTQYDGKHVEDVGLLKMDFLGLKTLSIIKDAVANIKLSKGIEVDIENVPLEDAPTYELYSRGETTGLFQFESDGMKKYLKDLKPTKFEDLIAMNALYRPGPMDYIPDFVDRKHGRKPIEYDFPIMEEVLKETYGITVYQEQVMLLSRVMAGFTRGQADSLRKAMGKKIQSMMEELKPLFVEGCKKLHNLKEEGINKVWEDWEKFASYAFNKSHATCYSYVSYQTAYLKAHYPAEFMAAVLSRNLNDIKKVSFFMDECKKMGMNVGGPDVNESYSRFTVNKEGDIRFGMAAIKGVGGAAVQNIIEERDANGSYKDIFDFVERINLSSVNKKTIEGLAMAGGFDSFSGIKRHQFFGEDSGGGIFIDTLVRYGNKYKLDQSNSQQSLFGGADSIEISKPDIPYAEEWSTLGRLNKEKELIGIYLSAHPLDTYKFEIENLNITPLSKLQNMEALSGKDITVVGLVTEAIERMTKTGKPFGMLTVEDYSDSYKIMMFSKDYMKFKEYFTNGYSLTIKGKIAPNRWKEPVELEFQINTIGMLADVREEQIKGIALKVPISKLTDKLIADVMKIAKDNPGKALLKFLIYDPVDKVWVQMFSRILKVNISNELIEFVENNPDIEFKIE